MVFSLTKETPKFNLTKEPTTSALKNLTIGAGWDPTQEGQSIDLDLVVSTNVANAIAFFNNLSVFEGAILHKGDNLTGDGDGVDEEVNIKLDSLPDEVTELEVAVISYSGQSFDEIQNEFVQISNSETGEVLVKSEDDVQGNGTTLILARIVRENNEWIVNLVNEMTNQSAQEYLSSKISQ